MSVRVSTENGLVSDEDFQRRLSVTEGDIIRLETKVEQMPAMAARLDGIEKSMDSLGSKVGGLQRTLVGFAFTVAVSALGLAVVILQAVGDTS